MIIGLCRPVLTQHERYLIQQGLLCQWPAIVHLRSCTGRRRGGTNAEHTSITIKARIANYFHIVGYFYRVAWKATALLISDICQLEVIKQG